MALCTAAELRYIVDSKTLTNTDYDNIITLASLEIVSRAGGNATVDTVNNNLKLACIHLAAATALRKMRANGELAASVKIGNAAQNNTPDPDIQGHEAEAKHFIILYRVEANGFSVSYGRVGPGSVNSENGF